MVKFKPTKIVGEVIMRENSMNNLVVGKSCFRQSKESFYGGENNNEDV